MAVRTYFGGLFFLSVMVYTNTMAVVVKGSWSCKGVCVCVAICCMSPILPVRSSELNSKRCQIRCYQEPIEVKELGSVLNESVKSKCV